MFEQLIFGGKGGTFPNSGPGPQALLAGDAHFGFFGEVTSSELLKGDEVSDLTGMWGTGASINNFVVWLKFIRNNTVVFIAKTPIRNTLSWDQLYSRGLVYGTDDNGYYPTGTATNQLTIIDKGSDHFKVRLPKGSDGNTTSVYNSNVNYASDGRLSEWAQLMYRVSASRPDAGNTTSWASYSNTDLGVTNVYTWAQESYSGNAAYKLTLGYASVGNSLSQASTLQTLPYAWRPVLELINTAGPMVKQKLVGTSTLLIATSTPNYSVEGGLLKLTDVVSSSDGDLLRMLGGIDTNASEFLINTSLPSYAVDTPLSRVSDITGSSNLIIMTSTPNAINAEYLINVSVSYTADSALSRPMDINGATDFMLSSSTPITTTSEMLIPISIPLYTIEAI